MYGLPTLVALNAQAVERKKQQDKEDADERKSD